MLSALLVALSAVGFLISSYFTAVSCRWIRPDAPWIPRFCRMGEKTCASIVHTPRARVLGLPNSLLGQVYYAALWIGLWSGLLSEPPYVYGFLGAALGTVLLGIFLSYSLLFWTRVPCPLCFTSHGINAAIFVILVSKWLGDPGGT